MTNFEIGRRIVKHEQHGKKRAAYGTELLKELSARLTEEFGRRFSVTFDGDHYFLDLVFYNRLPKEFASSLLQEHEPCPHCHKPFTTCTANGKRSSWGDLRDSTRFCGGQSQLLELR